MVIFLFLIWQFSITNAHLNSCRASSLIVVTEAVLGIAMMWLQATAHYRSAGILEWLLSYVGVFYIWTFIGFLEYVLTYDWVLIAADGIAQTNEREDEEQY